MPYNTQGLSDSISERLLFYKFTKLFSAMIILLSNGSYISLEIYFYLWPKLIYTYSHVNDTRQNPFEAIWFKPLDKIITNGYTIIEIPVWRFSPRSPSGQKNAKEFLLC